MADLTVATTGIRIVNNVEPLTLQAVEALTIGQSGYVTTAGKVGVADANVAGKQQTRVVALDAVSAGAWGSFAGPGTVLAGYTIAADYDAVLYQSDTAGAIADAAGTLNVPVGIVWPAQGPSGTEKCVRFDPRMRQDYT